MTDRISDELTVARGPSDSVVPTSHGGAVARVKTAATYDRVTQDMTGWRFAFSRRWLGYIACAVAFAIACAFLSHWQLDRGDQAVAANKLTHSNFYSVPEPLAQALPRLTSYSPAQEWRRVRVTGTYVASDQMFVRNRPSGSTPGFEVLTPLRLADGTLFVVDRGWVATGQNVNYPASRATPPRGTVTVVARLRASEPAFGGIPSIRNEIETIQLSQMEQRIGGRMYTGAYGLLDRQTPAAVRPLKSVVSSPPTADEGLHWSYMIQWIIFALVGFFGLAYALRTEFRKINQDDPEEQAREAERVRKQARKAFTDAEAEDELLDGYVSLKRWGFGGNAIAVPPPAVAPAPIAPPQVFVLAPATDTGTGESDSGASQSDSVTSRADAVPSEGEQSARHGTAESPNAGGSSDYARDISSK